jgi:hypothetical protein
MTSFTVLNVVAAIEHAVVARRTGGVDGVVGAPLPASIEAGAMKKSKTPTTFLSRVGACESVKQPKIDN